MVDMLPNKIILCNSKKLIIEVRQKKKLCQTVKYLTN